MGNYCLGRLCHIVCFLCLIGESEKAFIIKMCVGH